MTVAGWGVQKESSNTVANVLQKVDVAAVSADTCAKAMDPYEVKMFAVKKITFQKLTCEILFQHYRKLTEKK